MTQDHCDAPGVRMADPVSLHEPPMVADLATAPLRCHLSPPMNDSHLPWTNKGPGQGPATTGTTR